MGSRLLQGQLSRRADRRLRRCLAGLQPAGPPRRLLELFSPAPAFCLSLRDGARHPPRYGRLPGRQISLGILGWPMFAALSRTCTERDRGLKRMASIGSTGASLAGLMAA